MSGIQYREATIEDIPSLAKIRAVNSGYEVYWTDRIEGYLTGTVNPQKAMKERIIFVATDEEKIVGFVAGHLSQHYECDGELQRLDIFANFRYLEPLVSVFLLHLVIFFITVI